MARLRRGPSGKVVVIRDSAAGATMAPPMPCSARAPSSHAWLVANPPSRDASENRMMPAMNTRRRPRMSPARPPSSRKPPKVSAYALTTHSRPEPEKPSACWMWGRATFTMVASRTTMSWAVAMTSRARPRWRWAPVVALAALPPVSGSAVDMQSPWLKACLISATTGAAGRESLGIEGRALLGCARGGLGMALPGRRLSRQWRGGSQELTHLLGGPFGVVERAVHLDGGQRQAHLVHQRQQAGALLQAQRLPPGRPGQDLVLEPLLQLLARWCEHEPLHPAVAGVAFPGGQPTLLEHVGDAGDERGVAVQPAAQILLGERLALGHQPRDQPGHPVKDLEVKEILFSPRAHPGPPVPDPLNS